MTSPKIQASITDEKKKWHVYSEFAAAGLSAFLVSPSNAIIDRAVIEFANGKKTLQEGVITGFRKLFFTPLSFFTSFKFRWMFFVYGSTYGASNYSEHIHISDQISPPIQQLLLTFFANTGTGILKDKAYAQQFGAVASKSFPVRSLLIFFLRDLITIASAFTLPPIFAKILESKFEIGERVAITGAQLASPLLIQIIATPLHLLGLDLYNREGVTRAERFKLIKGLLLKAMTMRMIRFLPAYGIGGVANRELRRFFKNTIYQTKN